MIEQINVVNLEELKTSIEETCKEFETAISEKSISAAAYYLGQASFAFHVLGVDVEKHEQYVQMKKDFNNLASPSLSNKEEARAELAGKLLQGVGTNKKEKTVQKTIHLNPADPEDAEVLEKLSENKNTSAYIKKLVHNDMTANEVEKGLKALFPDASRPN